MQTIGDRRHWLSLDPRALREWAMEPLAVSLGMEPTVLTGVRAPNWVGMDDFDDYQPGGARHGQNLPAGVVYVGQGHHSHRFPRTRWASPLIAGVDGTREECMVLCADRLCRSGLHEHLEELGGKRLLCDCGGDQACVADVTVSA